MKKRILLLSVLILTALIIVIPQIVRDFRENLSGDHEVPVVSTTGKGQFNARITGGTISYQLSYSDLEGSITQAHIHLGQEDVNGGVSVWLCSNLASPPTPPGTQPCPASPATIFGNITASSVVGPASQGIEPGEFNELVRAIRAGNTYVNVHTTKFPGGEIRQQIDHRNDHRNDRGSDLNDEPR